MTKIKRRRRYDPEFKEQAVRLVLADGKTVKEIAEDLGIPDCTLSRWRREHLAEFDEVSSAGSSTATEMDEQLRQLRAET